MATNTSSLDAEWERIELLGHCLALSRQGRSAEDERIDRLNLLQKQVEKARSGGAWRAAAPEPLSSLEQDVLACAVAPEAAPRVAWMYQGLQPGTPQPYPTPALLQELLALDAADGGGLYAALGNDAPLRRHHLIHIDGEGPFEPVRPGPGVTDRLLNRPVVAVAPPGTLPVTARATWDDLVLPSAQVTILREFLLYIRYREKVVGEWGGGVSGGPVALFSGPSGTGKTFTGSVLAAELDWPLYRVDLGRLVSKYIGETEKNLNRLFDHAHGRPMILQFDEADSLFSKRGDVKEARDRYANMEVSHLLARIELHDGPCILTTNLRTQLDQAFARRFQVVIDFPRPGAAARRRLWRRLLPPGAPFAPNVDVDLLGDAVSLTGGGIRNAALHAAYLAAGAAEPIGLGHIATAVWRELAKEGREVNLSELGPLAGYLRGSG